MDNYGGQELTKTTISALKWSYGSTVVKVISQMLIGIVLARILGPKPFGLVAVAWIVIGFGNLIADFGFGAVLIQRKIISEEEIRYVFTVQVLLGVALTLIIVSLANPIAQVFNQRQLVSVVRALSLIFIAQSFGQTAISLLKRNLNFKGLRLAEVVSYILAYILLGIPLAYLGFGVWSLVIAQLSQSLLCSILTYLYVKHPIKPKLLFSPDLFSFGSKVMGTNMFNMAIFSMDNIFVGKFFGAVSLGLYERSFTLMTQPVNNIVTVLQGVLFPAYSRAQSETDKSRQAYLASVGIVSMITLPVFISIAMVPRTIIEGLYGDRWLGAVPLLVPLALAMIFMSISALSGPLIWGKGKVGKELMIQIVVATTFAAVLIVASSISVMAIAWGALGIYAMRFILMTRVALNIVEANWRDLMRVIRGGVIMCVCTGALVWSVDKVLLVSGLPVAIRLLFDSLIAGFGTLSIAVLFPGMLLASEAVWFVGRYINKLPIAIRYFIKTRGLEIAQ